MSVIELSTLYWDNTPPEQMRAHRAVMAKFGIDIHYYEENTAHGSWLDRVTAASKADVIGFFDSDCVPLSRERVQACIDYVLKYDSFCGIAQVANHIAPCTHVYAAPAFFLITRSCWERLGRPSFVHNPRSDVGEEITRAAEALGQRFRCLYPDSFEREPREGLWPLGNYGYYGIGTVFDQTVYHLYQGRFAGNLQLFIQRCEEIVAGTFDSAGHNSARLLDYSGRVAGVRPAVSMREYRHRLVTAGQSSPLYLSDVPMLWLRKLAEVMGRPLSVLDVGCGLGDQMRRIREQLPQALARVGGVDWSPATVRFHATSGIYDEMLSADSAALPAADQSWDVALSMENLEHLYGEQAVAAIRELARVGRHVVITTPLPRDVVNRAWLLGEIAAAEADPLPLPAHEYTCLESAVHKSALDPESMAAAGFTWVRTTPDHGHYFAPAEQVRAEQIRCLGIDEVPAPQGDDHRARYVALLRASLALGDRLAQAWPGQA